MTICATLYDGRTIVKTTKVVPVLAGGCSITLTFPELRTIDAVLHLQVDRTVPPAEVYGVGNFKSLKANVVGFTITSVSVATTLTIEGVVVGY